MVDADLRARYDYAQAYLAQTGQANGLKFLAPLTEAETGLASTLFAFVLGSSRVFSGQQDRREFAPMGDDRLQELRRRWRASRSPADETELLRARIRAGELDPDRLWLAGFLGYGPAVEASDDPDLKRPIERPRHKEAFLDFLAPQPWVMSWDKRGELGTLVETVAEICPEAGLRTMVAIARFVIGRAPDHADRRRAERLATSLDAPLAERSPERLDLGRVELAALGFGERAVELDPDEDAVRREIRLQVVPWALGEEHGRLPGGEDAA